MEKEILLKEIENTNHLNDLYQLWNEFKAYLENQPSLWMLIFRVFINKITYKN